jgi:S1-C subfamily serine protease
MPTSATQFESAAETLTTYPRRDRMVRFVIASMAIVATCSALPAAASDVVLLDFSSPSCGPCQQMVPTIESLKKAGYPIREVDVTREPQLAAYYNVPRVPAFIMLAGGRVVDRIEGGASAERLQRMFDKGRSELERQTQDRVRTQSPDRASPPAPWVGMGDDSIRSPDEPIRSPGYGIARTGGLAAGNGRPESTLPAGFDGSSRLESRLSTLLSASVRLCVEDAKGRSYGTGTVIDARDGDALIVTCGHLFRESRGQGPIAVDLFEATPQGIRSAGHTTGRVISYDLERDVALVAIQPGRPLAVAPLGPLRANSQRGDRVVTIGCNNGQDPTMLSTRITAIDRYQGAPNIEAGGAPVEGRSGGGLFNERGELIGVCYAADYEGNEGLYAAIEAVHDELDRRGLRELVLSNAASTNGGAVAAGNSPAAAGPIIRGQQPFDTLPSQVDPVQVAVAAPLVPARQPQSEGTARTSDTPKGINTAEQAAWEEIMGRAATSEVICIIRPKEAGGRSEVITLDGVSPEFVRALAERQQRSKDGLR